MIKVSGVIHTVSGDFGPRLFQTGDFGRQLVILVGNFGRCALKSDGDYGRCAVNSDAAVNSDGDFGRCAVNSDAQQRISVSGLIQTMLCCSRWAEKSKLK